LPAPATAALRLHLLPDLNLRHFNNLLHNLESHLLPDLNLRHFNNLLRNCLHLQLRHWLHLPPDLNLPHWLQLRHWLHLLAGSPAGLSDASHLGAALAAGPAGLSWADSLAARAAHVMMMMMEWATPFARGYPSGQL
jgi:hypothetical protein